MQRRGLTGRNALCGKYARLRTSCGLPDLRTILSATSDDCPAHRITPSPERGTSTGRAVQFYVQPLVAWISWSASSTIRNQRPCMGTAAAVGRVALSQNGEATPAGLFKGGRWAPERCTSPQPDRGSSGAQERSAHSERESALNVLASVGAVKQRGGRGLEN
jgi:hypothetical protein